MILKHSFFVHLHLALILCPPIQCCVGAVVCAFEEIENSTLFGGEGGIVSKTLENRILLASVSTLLSPIVGRYNFPMLSRVSVRVTKNYVLPRDSTYYTCFRSCTTTPNHNYVTLSIRFLLLYEQILDVFINAEFCNTG